MVISDLNAKIGSGAEGDLIGAHGLGTRNTRGDRLVQFCVENNFLIANTLFKQHPRRLYTWTSPQHTPEKIVRNQIDFIMVAPVFRKYIKSVKTYPGADVNSGHTVLVMDFKMKRFKNIKRQVSRKSIDLDKLRNPDTLEEIETKLETKLKNIEV